MLNTLAGTYHGTLLNSLVGTHHGIMFNSLVGTHQGILVNFLVTMSSVTAFIPRAHTRNCFSQN